MEAEAHSFDDEGQAYGDGAFHVLRSGDLVEVTRHGKFDGASGVLLASFDQSTNVLSLFPHEGVDRGGDAAYTQLREVRIDASACGWHPEAFVRENFLPQRSGVFHFIDALPEGVGSGLEFGLQFPKSYRRIAEAVEQGTQCTTLCIGAVESKCDADVLMVSLSRFTELVETIKLTQERGSRVAGRINDLAARNLVNEALGLAAAEPSRNRLPELQKMTDAVRGSVELDDEEAADLLTLLERDAANVSRRQPHLAMKVREDLELVALKELIDRFTDALDDPKTSTREQPWQDFFNNNRFALQQLFGAPVVWVDERGDGHAHVKPARSDGTGARVVDFLLMNTVTAEGLIVEIKTPVMPLMLDHPYRGQGSSSVYGPSKELVEAAAQIQSQMQSLNERLQTRLDPDDPLLKVECTGRRGALIAGRVDHLSPEQRQGFVRYREGLSTIDILGFDEVRGRLVTLRDLLTGPERSPLDPTK